MEFDFSNGPVSPGVIVFPGWDFPDQPIDPGSVGETVILQGSSTGDVSIVGSVDS